MTDLSVCCRRMYTGEYVDLGNGLWLCKDQGGSVHLVREQQLRNNRILVNGEISRQRRRQRDIPQAPCPEPDPGTNEFRCRWPQRHRLCSGGLNDFFVLRHASNGSLVFLNKNTTIANGVVRLIHPEASSFILSTEVTGAVWGEFADQSWPSAESAVFTAALHLNLWSWFDPDNQSHSCSDFQQMLLGVAGLTKVRALTLFFRECMLLREGHNMGSELQEWILFFPFSVERMSQLVSLAPGCFCAWSVSREVREQPHFFEWWGAVVTLMNQGFPQQRVAPSDTEQESLFDQETQTTNLWIDTAPFTVEDYPDRPGEFTQDDANLFDRTMGRLLFTESEERHGV